MKQWTDKTSGSILAIVISSRLSETDRVFMNISEEMPIEPDNKLEKFMKYHREVIFDSF